MRLRHRRDQGDIRGEQRADDHLGAARHRRLRRRCRPTCSCCIAGLQGKVAAVRVKDRLLSGVQHGLTQCGILAGKRQQDRRLERCLRCRGGGNNGRYSLCHNGGASLGNDARFAIRWGLARYGFLRYTRQRRFRHIRATAKRKQESRTDTCRQENRKPHHSITRS